MTKNLWLLANAGHVLTKMLGCDISIFWGILGFLPTIWPFHLHQMRICLRCALATASFCFGSNIKTANEKSREQWGLEVCSSNMYPMLSDIENWWKGFPYDQYTYILWVHLSGRINQIKHPELHFTNDTLVNTIQYQDKTLLNYIDIYVYGNNHSFAQKVIHTNHVNWCISGMR